MNRTPRVKPAVFALSVLSVTLMLSACVSSPTVDEDTNSSNAESTSPQSSPSPTGTAAAEEDEVSDASSGDSTSPQSPTQPQTPAQPGSSTPAQPPAPAPAPSSAPAAPALAVISQKCVSGRLTVMMTASYSSDYRKGIRSVVVERQNEYNAWIDGNATWLGPETGAGNQWTAQPPGSRQQRFKDTLRITASADGGAKTVVNTTITAPC